MLSFINHPINHKKVNQASFLELASIYGLILQLKKLILGTSLNLTNNMKIFKFLFLTLLTTSVFAQDFKIPTKSPLQTIKQEFALSSIEVEYSRPGTRSRIIFGDLVPYGNLWRTGANNQTLITFGEDVSLNGTAVKQGKYTILSRPSVNSWELLFCSPSTSVFNFQEDNVIFSIEVPAKKTNTFYESFTIGFSNQTDNSVNVDIAWENTMVTFEVVADIDAKVMRSIDAIMSADNRPYFAAASYYYDNDKDMDKALEWVNKALEQNPAFFITHVKAKIQLKAGDKAGAMLTARQALKEAQDANNLDYIALNKKLIDLINN